MMDRASRTTRALALLDTRAVIMANGGAPRPLTFCLMREARRRAFVDIGLKTDEIRCPQDLFDRYGIMFGATPDGRRYLPGREELGYVHEFDGAPVICDQALPAGVMQMRRGDRVLVEIWDLGQVVP